MSQAAFWLIVGVLVGFTIYSLASQRRNPPMRKCVGCNGDGVVWPYGVIANERPLICVGCNGEGWLEVVR